MLFGTADLDALAIGAPRMERLDTEPLVLAGAWVLQVTYEMSATVREALLPPGLHPTDPPLVSWRILRAAGGPLGPFALAELRIECRSGLRPRGFLVASVVDSVEAGGALAARWGYRWREGRIALGRHYDAVRGTVALRDETILDVALLDPDPLRPHDVPFPAGMHLSPPPRGPRPLP